MCRCDQGLGVLSCLFFLFFWGGGYNGGRVCCFIVFMLITYYAIGLSGQCYHAHVCLIFKKTYMYSISKHICIYTEFLWVIYI